MSALHFFLAHSMVAVLKGAAKQTRVSLCLNATAGHPAAHSLLGTVELYLPPVEAEYTPHGS